MIRALVFDVFGTLVDWRSSIARAFAAAGVDGDPSELADDWRGRYAPALEESNRGQRPAGTLDELHGATLDELLAARGLPPVDDATKARLVRGWHELDPWPDVRDGLELLRRDRVTATLSNGHVALLVDLARHGDLRFDAILSAELAGAYKPARAGVPPGGGAARRRTCGAHARRRASVRPRGRTRGRAADGVRRPPARARRGVARPLGP